MEDFVLCQGDTIKINYVIPEDLTFKTVYFAFGNSINGFKQIKCTPQSVTSQNYKRMAEGGICIPFTGQDLENPGSFFAQFFILDTNGHQTTYPPVGYLSVKIQQSVF